jgi:hypothetical protein
MKYKLCIFLLLFNGLFFAKETPDSLIHRMMVTTGTVSSLGDILDNLQKDVFRFSENTTTEDSELVKNEVASVFNIDSLTERYISNFKAKYSEKNVNEVLEAYKNPVYIKATELETRDISDEDIDAYIKNYNPGNYSERRLNLISRLKEAARVSDFSYYSLKSTLQVAVTVNNALSGLEEGSGIESMVDMMITESEAEMDKFITIFLLQCYEELTDDELEEYVDYYESDLGKWHTEVSMTSYLNTLSQSADIFTETFPAKTKSRKI